MEACQLYGHGFLPKERSFDMADDFIYTPATTDITIRWRKLYNWVPPSENPAQQKKWEDFRMQSVRGIAGIAAPAPQQPLPKPRLINAGKIINYD